jgi:membrane protein
MKWVKEGWELVKDTYKEWTNDKVPRLAAALSYYTIFSIAPLLIVVIAVAGFVFGDEAVRGQLDNQIRGLVGTDAALTIQAIPANLRTIPSPPSSG